MGTGNDLPYHRLKGQFDRFLAAQPEGAFLTLVNWIGNVIAPVGAALAIAGGLVSYIAGRGVMRYVVTALGCLAVSGVTRLLEFWIQQGGGGVS